MGRHDWCRRTTWTRADQKAFAERNARSRGAENKAQYMRFQAETLLETARDQPSGGRRLALAALKLVEASLAQFPDVSYRAASFDCAGQCCEFLGKIDEAVAYYEAAIAREDEFPGIRTNACYHLGRVAVEDDRPELCGRAIAAIKRFGAPIFPWHVYHESGVRAYCADRGGDAIGAAQLARQAIAASEVSDSGFDRGRGRVGLVRDTRTRFHRRVRDIAGV